MVNIGSPSNSGRQGQRNTWAQKFKTRLGHIVRPCLRERKVQEHWSHVEFCQFPQRFTNFTLMLNCGKTGIHLLLLWKQDARWSLPKTKNTQDIVTQFVMLMEWETGKTRMSICRDRRMACVPITNYFTLKHTWNNIRLLKYCYLLCFCGFLRQVTLWSLD